MWLYKCKDCGLITSEIFNECPKCYSQNDQQELSVSELTGSVFTITDEDVKSVIENLEEKDREKMSKYTDEVIMSVVSKKIDIPWDEYVEGLIQARFL